MDVKYCKRCGKIFNYKVSVYCPACIVKNDEDFLKCRDYIEKNKYVTINELSENTGVDEKIILMFLKEGRLSLNTGSGLTCENCGAPISQGRYCEDCLIELKRDFSSVKSLSSGRSREKDAKASVKYNKSNKMHILNRIKVDKERDL